MHPQVVKGFKKGISTSKLTICAALSGVNCLFFIDLQSTEVTDETYEHVALVTFGHETKVQHHLSYEYFELLIKLGKVLPSGSVTFCHKILQGFVIVCCYFGNTI